MTPSSPSYAVFEAPDTLRETIYQHRHRIYAQEIGQHATNGAGMLQDRLDQANRYIAVTYHDALAGFISITPPGDHGYSIDKYFDRDELPFSIDSGSYELRLLTVLPDFRASQAAATLMLAAFRWVESRGGDRVIAIGRRELRDMYQRCGMTQVGRSIRSGAVTYDLMHASVDKIRKSIDRSSLPAKIERETRWQLDVALQKPADCFHGGAFFDAIGTNFSHLERRRNVINADVLDAWFPPAPAVIEALQANLSWLLQTSPPTACEGLHQAISCTRGIPETSILVGAGSSDLIYRALPRWLDSKSTALILDPTYGEYAHVLEKVIGCTVVRSTVEKEDHYNPDFEKLTRQVAEGPDLVTLVNPNSPTGKVIDRETIERIIEAAPAHTRFWIDETYVDYTPGESLESLAAGHDRLIVCKSMSKAYALSGARVAYLCASPHQLEELRTLTPPWVVGLPSQVAAVKALSSPDYYRRRWKETAKLRMELEDQLEELGMEVTTGCANFVLASLPPTVPDAEEFVRSCREQLLFIRNASPMGSSLGTRAIRIAVKDAGTQQRILRILSEELQKFQASFGSTESRLVASIWTPSHKKAPPESTGRAIKPDRGPERSSGPINSGSAQA